jgi:glycosyltransferase involved in cell wall biosynthesis
MKRIVIIPFHNEEKTVGDVLGGALKKADLVILVNDCSTDASERAALEAAGDSDKVIYLPCPARGGKARAMGEGFVRIESLVMSGDIHPDDIVVTIDGDGQLDPGDIDPLCTALADSGADMVIACRDLTLYPNIKRLGNRFLSAVAAALTGAPFRDTQCGLRAMRAGILGEILRYYHGVRYTGEQQLSVLAPLLGYKARNDVVIRPVYYRSNSTILDAFLNTVLAFTAFLQVITGIRRERSSGEKPREAGIESSLPCEHGAS